MTALHQGTVADPERALDLYRVHLYLEGSDRRETLRADGSTMRGALEREAGLKVLAAKGKLPLKDLLRCRVRYFADGAICGSRDFVDRMFADCRQHFGPARRTGARRMRGFETELYVARDLRKTLFG